MLLHSYDEVQPSTISIIGTCVVGIVLGSLVWTWLSSSLQSFPAKPNTGHEPPMVPYVIPYLGHIFGFLQNPGDLLQRLSKRYANTPFSLQMPGAKFHIITSPDTAFHIFTKPRDYICEPVVASMMSNALELEGADYEKFNVPISPHRKPSDLTVAERESIAYVGRNHSIYLQYLSGRSLDPIMDIYTKNFRAALDQKFSPKRNSSQSWKLHETLQKLVFDASCMTFFGKRIYNTCPEIWQHWRSFNEAAYIGVRSRASFYLRPWTLHGRRQMLKAFDTWVTTDLEDWEDEEIWSEKWGVKLNWEREKLSRDHNMSTRGRSCVHVSFLWVIITNTAPMLTWFIGVLLENPEILKNFQSKVDSYLDPGPVGTVDTAKFCADSFIQSIWKEALRLGVTSASARVVTRDSQIDGYTVKKGSVVLIPTRILHFDQVVFPNPTKFNPWRWVTENGTPDGAPISAERLKAQNHSLRPFGGGTGVCSGRFIAEREVLTAAAILLHQYEFEVEPGQQIPRPNLNPRGLGAMYPLVDPMVAVRRRI